MYVSYFGGAVGVHRGLWHPDLDAFFGVEHQLRYGMVAPIDDDVIEWTMQVAFPGTPAAEGGRVVFEDREERSSADLQSAGTIDAAAR